MNSSDRLTFGAQTRRGSGLFAPFLWLAGVIATVAAMAVGAVLAVFTAAAVAVIALFAGVVIFFAGLAMRARRKVTPQRRAGDGDVIEARKVDGAWVAYGWERTGR
ncbi:MAG: hypothetical protein EON89_02265 [Brevundimonas sp.]|nr:MAG: hypothetical protein EON89_02265 [Brevundimonas sp.]